MNFFSKKIGQKYSFLILMLVINIGMNSACTASERNSGNNQNGATTQNSAAAGEKGHAAEMTNVNKVPAKTPQETAVEIADGRKFDSDKTEKEASTADQNFVSKEFKSRETQIREKLADNYCSEPNDAEVNIYNAVEGSFTKSDAKQKAYVYSICELGRGFGVGGILIAENDVVVAHYVGQIGWSARLSTLPDINKDGVAEILYADGGSGQGYTSTSVEILNFKDGTFKSLGEAQTYSDNSGAAEDESKAETLAYKISVQPASAPVFLREVYEKKGNAKDWTLVKKSEKFSLENGNLAKFTRID